MLVSSHVPFSDELLQLSFKFYNGHKVHKNNTPTRDEGSARCLQKRRCAYNTQFRAIRGTLCSSVASTLTDTSLSAQVDHPHAHTDAEYQKNIQLCERKCLVDEGGQRRMAKSISKHSLDSDEQRPLGVPLVSAKNRNIKVGRNCFEHRSAWVGLFVFDVQMCIDYIQEGV